MSEPTLITLGCRLNAAESEVMRVHARDAGLRDTVIINTCAVTQEAVRQAKQTIRRTRRERPGATIIVTGCAAQIEPERFAGMSEVDRVIGNVEKTRRDVFAGIADGGGARVRVGDIMAVRETASHMTAAFGIKARAFVQVQNGCDHRCTFCIIPFGRGPSRSVPAGAVVAEVRQLVERGMREIVLTGVDITSYGRDLPGESTLGRLVKQVLRHVPELKRLRLSSIDQVEADRDLLDAIASEPRLLPHFHLSLQAGSDLILKRMKRRHNRRDAIDFCAGVRRLRPDVAFGADFIAGFPTETDAHFDDTLRLVDECGLAFLHVFPFSPRPGVPAARMPQVPRDVVKSRAGRLRGAGERALTGMLQSHVGSEVGVLIEKGASARTDHYAEIELGPHVSGDGMTGRARVTGRTGFKLHGELVA